MRNKTAEKYAKKLLNYVMSIDEGDKAIYKTTRKNLQALAEIASEIEKTANNILQGTRHRTATCEKIESVANTDDKEITETEIIPEIKPEILQNEPAPKPKNPITKLVSEHMITPDDSRKIVHVYAENLEKAAQAEHENETVNKCSKLIWDWFSKRILYKPKNFKQVHYNPMHFPQYLAAITISLGYHIKKCDLDSYICKFENWLDMIDVDKKTTNRYIFPFECNEIYKNLNIDYASVHSFYLWDCLLDIGYENLGGFPISGDKDVPYIDEAVVKLYNKMKKKSGTNEDLKKEYHDLTWSDEYKNLF